VIFNLNQKILFTKLQYSIKAVKVKVHQIFKKTIPNVPLRNSLCYSKHHQNIVESKVLERKWKHSLCRTVRNKALKNHLFLIKGICQNNFSKKFKTLINNLKNSNKFLRRSYLNKIYNHGKTNFVNQNLTDNNRNSNLKWINNKNLDHKNYFQVQSKKMNNWYPLN
jgi:hypothetical protein